jgi:biopolymer transport protein ExbD
MAVMIQVRHATDVTLPVPCAGVCADGDAIVLEVRPRADYRINGAHVANADLPGRLYEIYHGRPNKIIQVAGYPGVSYQTVVTAMDVARSSGARVVGLAPRDSYLPR